ncbi:phosphoglycerate dehydrogenase [bacterium]|nr:phosphoglycerate dehydrogenase [bacterium]
MKKILITEPFAQEAVNLLKEAGFEVVLNFNLTDAELMKEITNFDGLIVRSKTKVNEKIIKAGNKLKIIGRAGVGVDNIDVETATRQGVMVMNAPNANTISTAELAILFIMALSRNFYQAVHSTKEGKWEKSKFNGSELYKKTLGIIGLGRIGTQVAKRAMSFGMEVVAFDPFVSRDKEKTLNIKLISFEELLQKADYITLHLALTKESYHLLNEEAFKKMKTGVRIVNCARGGIIDEEALFNAIKEKKVIGCGLDVFEKEPPLNSPLLKLSEVIITPHLGASTQEAQVNVSLQMAKQFKNALLNEVIDNSINCPTIDSSILATMQPYITISEKMGSFQGQLTEESIEKIEITYTGDLTNNQTQILTLSFLKGFLACIIPSTVNYVNAMLVAKERGIKVVEKHSNYQEDFPNLITAEITTPNTKSSVSGTLLGKNDLRIVKINGYRVDVYPSGHLLFCMNVDKPGVVSHISSVLTEVGVNIANMTVGREAAGGQALIVLNIDNTISKEVLLKIKENPIITKAVLVEL